MDQRDFYERSAATAHQGNRTWDRRVWRDGHAENGVKFRSYLSVSLAEPYPGDVHIRVWIPGGQTAEPNVLRWPDVEFSSPIAGDGIASVVLDTKGAQIRPVWEHYPVVDEPAPAADVVTSVAPAPGSGLLKTDSTAPAGG